MSGGLATPFGSHPTDEGRAEPRTIKQRITRERRIARYDADQRFLRLQSEPPAAPPADAFGHARHKGQRDRRIFTPLTTSGCVNGPHSFVYVGARNDGRCKIGMSGSPEARCRTLGARLLLALPTVTEAAKAVETEALRLLGAAVGDGEWVILPDPAPAMEAARAAWAIVGRRMHVDPVIDQETARLNRIADMASICA